MQGSIGIVFIAALAAVALVAGSGALPWVALISVVAAAAVGLDRVRTARRDLR